MAAKRFWTVCGWTHRYCSCKAIFISELTIALKLFRHVNLPAALPFLANSLLDFSITSVYCEFDFRKRPLIDKGTHHISNSREIFSFCRESLPLSI